MKLSEIGKHIKKRDSCITEKVFPFEAIHTRGPANNMLYFHWHDFMEISHVHSGRGTFYIEEKEYNVKEGDIIIINNIERHRVTFDEKEPLYETVLHFSPTLLWSKENTYFDYNYLKLFVYEGARFNNRPQLSEDIQKEIGWIIENIKNEYTKKPSHYELMIKSRLFTLITLLLRHSTIREEGQGNFLIRKKNIERIESILKYINDNFKEDISLVSIADHFAMNPSYFSDFFKKNVGETFLHHLARIRVNHAIRLLNENKLNSTEIAFESGFSGTSGFYKAFKRITTKTPGEFREYSEQNN